MADRRWALAVLALSILLVASGLADTLVGTGAAQLSGAARKWWSLVGVIGLSETMYVVAATVIVAAILVRRRTTSPERRRLLRLLVERTVYVVGSVASAQLVAQIIKRLVGRGRPRLLDDVGAFHFEPLSAHDVLQSFPSGHTTNAFCAAVALGYMAPRLRPALLGLATLIGLSRIGAGAHFPSDVVGGAALGTAVAMLLARVFQARGFAFDATRAGLVIRPFPRWRRAPVRPG